MRIPFSWLREAVRAGAPDWDVTVEELEQTFIRIGHEVEEIIPIGPVSGPLTVGRVAEIEELTEFKKPIRACKVDVGIQNVDGEHRDIVCGATNFAVGDLVGDGPLRHGIAERMRAAGLEDRLWLPGVRSDVAQILRALDCFALPSFSEATSCTLQEAMATGLPIVVTNVGGNGDLLEQGRCGSLVPSGNVQAMASEILRHFQTDGVHPQAAAALTAAKMHHGLDVTVQRYQDLFLNKKP